MNNNPIAHDIDAEDNNALPPRALTSHPLKNAGWLCGFRMDNMDGPQVASRQVASYVEGATPFIEEKVDVFTEIITAHNKRESNYVHHGWSRSAATTASPWTVSRIDATNRHNAGGTWITRRTLVPRLRVQVPLEDLIPDPDFEAAIEEALTRPSRFEKSQAIYRALGRWGDVVPLEIETGLSLSLTDTEANFTQLPATISYNFAHLSNFKTISIARKGAASNVEWSDGTWTMVDVPATGWRLVRVLAVAPTINLLADNLQGRLSDLYAEKLSYAPSHTFDPIGWERKIHDDVNHASRAISTIEVNGTNHILGLKIKYLDGVLSHGGTDGGNHHVFALNSGEHIIENLTCTDSEWLYGIQFITNTGRCSVIYGVLEGTPAVLSSKRHPQWDYMFTGLRGIWRHDLIPRAPKENDVYSEYFGARNHQGRDFNDRGLIGNSSFMYISSIEVRSGGDIDSIQFTYKDTRNSQNDRLNTARHGGTGGAQHQFELRNEEHIVSVSGRFTDHALTQLCFTTSLGRTTDTYGGGDGQPFTALAPRDDSGRQLRLQYIVGKSNDTKLKGIMFAWTPCADPQ